MAHNRNLVDQYTAIYPGLCMYYTTNQDLIYKVVDIDFSPKDPVLLIEIIKSPYEELGKIYQVPLNYFANDTNGFNWHMVNENDNYPN